MTFHVYECGEGAREVPYSEIWDYEAQPKEHTACNLCGALKPRMRLDLLDRYGYTQRSADCGECGLNYLFPRMTREAYARFYETGAYRALVSAFHGREINAETLREEQVPYAVQLVGYLESWMGEHGPLRYGRKLETLLDVGGSSGVVAHRLAGSFALRALVIEPGLPEVSAAASSKWFSEGWVPSGVGFFPGTLEQFETERRFDLITLCQTADHLLDLMGSLRKIKSLLSPDGLFWSDIVDFDVTREVKIDHPFNLTEKTYRMFLEKAGFKLLQINYAPDGKHIGFLAR